MKEIEFKDKVILITGATGGIGSEIVKLLSKNRCKLVLFGRKEEKLKELCNKLNNNIGECTYKICNVVNRSDVKESVESIYKTYGRIDIAILSSGILVRNPLDNFKSETIKNSMDVNFFGNMYFLEFLLPIMKSKKSSTIAVVSTLADKRGRASWSAYQSSKAALSIALECLRIEAKKKYNINIITIKPGSVRTPIINNQSGPGVMEPDKAAKIILNGIKKGKDIIEFPLTQVIPVRLTDLFPAKFYDIINKPP